MCGHVGMAGNLTPQDEKAFHNLLVMDSVRGIDSTGVAVIHRGDADYHICKGVGDTYRLMDRKAYDKAFMGFHRCIIGHNRYATQGSVNDKNAHPYDFDTLIGAHNGTLTNKWQLEDSRDFQVDSANLYHHIEKKGLDNLMTVMLGAWALVWWDKENETLNLLRNKERTLYICYSPDGKKLYWASEAWMLIAALGRNNIEHTPPMLLAEDNLYSVKISKTGEMDKAHLRYTPSTGKPYVSVTNLTNYRGSNYNSVQQQQASAYPPAKVTQQSGEQRVVPATTEAKDEVQKSLLRSSNAGYASSKQVLLEVLGSEKDIRGSTYLICFDAKNPSYSIRLYCNQNVRPMDYIDKEIVADISGLNIIAGEAAYYKVAVHSVEILGDDEDDPVGDSGTYLGHKNNRLNYNDWVGMYGDCVWCGSHILPTDKHLLTTEGQAVCQGCGSDSEVTDYIKVSVNSMQ